MRKLLLFAFAMLASATALQAQTNLAKNAAITLDGDAVSFYTVDNRTTPVTVDASKMSVFVDGEIGANYRFAGWKDAVESGDGAADNFIAQSFVLDLGSKKTNLGLIKVYFINAYAKAFKIEYSENKSDWTTWQDISANSSETVSSKLASAVDAQYLRFSFTQASVNGWGIAIKEIEVYEDATPALTTLTASANITSLNPGGTATITTSTLDQFGSAIEATVTYVSSNTGVVTVSNGTVTAVANGTATVTVTAQSGEVTKTADILFTVESPFAAPATIATEPTADAANVIAIFSQKYGKVDKKDNNPAWGGGPDPLWSSFEDVTISDHTVKHVLGTGYADRPATAITTDYSKAFVALYPKSATSGKLYADGGYAQAETFTLTPGQWNYVQVAFAKETNYVMVELVGETEFYLDHFYVTKPAAGALDITLGSTGKVTVTGPLSATNKSELNVAAYAEAVLFDLTGVTVAEGTGAVETQSVNAVVLANQADETKLAGTKNLCHDTSGYLVFAKNGETAPTVTIADGHPVATDYIWAQDNGVTYKYTRQLSAGQVASFVFPAAVTLPDGVKAYTLSSYADNVISFTEVETGTALTANTPYILVAESAAEVSYNGTPTTENGLDFKTGAGKAEASGITLQGTFSPVQGDGTQYVLQANATAKEDKVTFFKTGSRAVIDPFRAYLTNVPSGARIQLRGFDDEATGITTTHHSSPNTRLFDLQGRRIGRQEAGKGLYIMGGKKVIIK